MTTTDKKPRRDTHFQVRVTREEKAEWVVAAGGLSRVSDWVRRVLGRAAKRKGASNGSHEVGV